LTALRLQLYAAFTEEGVEAEFLYVNEAANFEEQGE
jgi:hypothetical protein